MDNKEYLLIKYSWWSDINAKSGSYTITEYTKTGYNGLKFGRISMEVCSFGDECSATFSDKIRGDEVTLIEDFINTEIKGKEFTSENHLDGGCKIEADDKVISNNNELTQKFLATLDKIRNTHELISEEKQQSTIKLLDDYVYNKHSKETSTND